MIEKYFGHTPAFQTHQVFEGLPKLEHSTTHRKTPKNQHYFEG